MSLLIFLQVSREEEKRRKERNPFSLRNFFLFSFCILCNLPFIFYFLYYNILLSQNNVNTLYLVLIINKA
jgi:hypothetical protein